MRFLALVVAVLMVSGVAFASDISTENLLNRVYDSTNKTLKMYDRAERGTLTRIRVATTNDASTPTQGSGIDCSGYSKVRVLVQTNGTTAVRLTPLWGDSTYTTYFIMSGDAKANPDTYSRQVVASTDSFILEVNGAPDFYFQVSEFAYSFTGESENSDVTIDAIPFN